MWNSIQVLSSHDQLLVHFARVHRSDQIVSIRPMFWPISVTERTKSGLYRFTGDEGREKWINAMKLCFWPGAGS